MLTYNEIINVKALEFLEKSLCSSPLWLGILLIFHLVKWG